MILFPLTSLFKAHRDDGNYDSIMGIGSALATTGIGIRNVFLDVSMTLSRFSQLEIRNFLETPFLLCTIMIFDLQVISNFHIPER